MSILIKNARVLTMDKSNMLVDNSCIFIKEDKIDFVGAFKDLKVDIEDSNVIDAKGRLVMPGLINTHNHIAMTLFRNYADDLNLHTWLDKYIYPKEDELNCEQVYWASLLSIAEMIRGGITCTTDMYFFSEDTAKAVCESGIRGYIGRSGAFLGKQEDVKNYKGHKEEIELYDNWNGKFNGRMRVMVAPHAIYTCSSGYIKECIQYAKEKGFFLEMHLSETKKEVEDCVKEHGVTPIKYCESIGLFEVPTILPHCVHTTDEDLNILAKYDNVSVSHNPSSNLKLGSGIARIPDMIEKGINVCLGTDGAGSNNRLDLFGEMRLAGLIHKGNTFNPEVVKAIDVLKMATVNGAKAVLNDKIGIIKKGNKADLIIIDTDRENYLPDYNIISALIYSSNSRDVDTVIIDGNIVMRDKIIETIDIEKVKYNVKRMI